MSEGRPCIQRQILCVTLGKLLPLPKPYFAHLCLGSMGLASSSKGWHFSGSQGQPGVWSDPAIVWQASRVWPSTARPSQGRKCRYLQEMQDKAWEVGGGGVANLWEPRRCVWALVGGLRAGIPLPTPRTRLFVVVEGKGPTSQAALPLLSPLCSKTAAPCLPPKHQAS